MSMRLIAALMMTAALPLAAAADTPINETFRLERDGEVDVSNVKGSIKVFGWDEAMVEITGTLGEGVEKLEIDRDDDSIRVEVKNANGWFKKSKNTHLVLRVPFEAELELDGVSSSIEVEGSRAPIEAESVSGSITIRGGRESVDAETVSGGIEIESEATSIDAESVSGRIRIVAPTTHVNAETVSGGIEIEGASGDVDCETVSGSIQVVGGSMHKFHASTTSGSIRIEGDLARDGELSCGSHSGSIRVTFGKPVSARFELETFSGSIRADLRDAPEFRGGKHISFTAGDGRGKVELGTFSGSIRVED